jgi:NADH:ubiquinone oxidoreductase subunit E
MKASKPLSREKILNAYGRTGDNLLAILHDIQSASPEHYLSDDDLRAAADYLSQPYSFVHGVATFYTMYSLKPRGRNLIRVCQSPPCHLLGSSTISRELIRLLGIGFGETTPDRLFTLEMTSCLGVCGVAPAMMVNERVYGNLTAERIAEVIEGLRRAK